MARQRLVVFDTDDLQVVSALTQDALIRIGDMTWLANERRFALMMNRFAWEVPPSGKGDSERRRAGMVIDFVSAVSSFGINMGARDGVLALLSLQFEARQAPAGHLFLNFAGGGAIRLAVDCLELRLDDTGAAWSSTNRPDHETG